MFERYSDRARRLIFMALWSARNRGGSYIEPEDLLHALIREDRGEFVAFSAVKSFFIHRDDGQCTTVAEAMNIPKQALIDLPAIIRH